ncbi:MAG: hypothetical protein E3J55_00580 [Dehalococcoidia bacterium]|nr:MAG: hypothetical protein E3J55_00580 [Dehalococcoidia bacterium]
MYTRPGCPSCAERKRGLQELGLAH